MQNVTVMLFGVGLVAGILLIIAVKKQLEWLLDFILRGVMGTLAIYLINSWFLTVGIVSGVLLHPATVLTVTILGFPGVLGLYTWNLFKSM